MEFLTLLQFKFTAPLHIANVRADYDRSESILHSDALYSAIIQAWSVLGIEHPILTGNEPNPNIDFTLSSLFPYYQETADSRPILFFPKPKGALQAEGYEGHKKVKKVKFIEQDSFLTLLRGENLNLAHIKGSYYLGEQFKQEFDDDFVTSNVVPRVTVPRYEEADEKGNPKTTDIFYMERIYFKYHSGLFCLAQFDSEVIRQKVSAALHYLQDTGIGSDRNVGNGFFKLYVQPYKAFESLPAADYATNLSLFCPSNQETLENILADENCNYELLKRGGWITENNYLRYRKNSVYMFSEGSIFKTTATAQGKTVDLLPNLDELKNMHRIYRVGKSLFVPISAKSLNKI